MWFPMSIRLVKSLIMSDTSCCVSAPVRPASTPPTHERWLQEHVPWLLKPYSHRDLARELKALLVPALH